MVSRNQSFLTLPQGFPGGTVVKNPPASAGDVRDTGSVPESERSRGEGNGNPLSVLAWRIRRTEELVGYSP